MTKLILKSLLIGFIIGTVFLGIAPIGLGSVFVARLFPVLAPGPHLMRGLALPWMGPFSWIVGISLNGLIYTIVVLMILLLYRYVVQRRADPGQKEE